MTTQFSLSFDLPFLEAAEIASARLPMLPSEYYSALMDGARRTASTVSNLASMQQIKDVLDSLHSAMVTGSSLTEWKKWASEQGWGLNDGHLQTIYRTNVQTAYMSGHVRGFEVTANERPYLLYSAINDARTRPTHAKMSGYIARWDDTIWRKWTPPCGYNCRCSLVSLTEEQARARGYGKQSQPSVEPDPGFGGDPRDGEERITKRIGEFGKTMPDEIAMRSAQILADLPVNVDEYLNKMFPVRFDKSYVRLLQTRRAEAITAGDIPRTITDAEFVSLVNYTGPGYREINPVLWHTNTNSRDYIAQKWDFRRVEAVAINNALVKMKPYEGTTFRKVKSYKMDTKALEEFWKTHKVGEVVQYNAFSSTSTVRGMWSGDITLQIESRVGRYIDKISDNIGEEEVLYPAGARFRITKIVKKGDSWTIYMEDVTGLDVQTTQLFVVEHHPTVHRHANRKTGKTVDQHRSQIEDRWQAEMTPPRGSAHSFQAMCDMYPQFAEAARALGTLK